MKFLKFRYLYLSLVIQVFLLLPAYSQQKEHDMLIKNFKHIKSADSSENYASQLIALAKQKHDELFEAQILYAQSMKVFKAGNEIRALNLAYQANGLTSVKDSVTYTNSATMIAYMLSRRGKNLEGLNVAFDILRKTDAHGWKKQGIGCLNCIADLYRVMGDPKKALPYALQASKDALNLQDTALYTLSLSTLSNLYSAKQIENPQNLIRAAGYLETLLAPPYFARLNDYSKTQYYSNLGRIYMLQRRYPESEKVQQQALTIARANKFIALEKHILNELVTCENNLGHYQFAITLDKQALTLQADAQTNRSEVKNIYHQLSDAYRGLHDYKNALDYEERATDISDSLNSIDKDKAGTELSEKYKADRRLLIADGLEQKAKVQRDFIIVIALIGLLGIIAGFRWFAYKKKKEAALLNEQHTQLARLDAMKTRFFANISHELRTPITLIMGPAEQMLNSTWADPQQQANAHTIVRNSKKLLNMVNELLDLGRAEHGSLPLKLKPVELAWYINVIYQGFASAATYKNINYSLSNLIPADLFVELDTEKFEKIANNLISNALKFTPANGSVNVIAVIRDGLIAFTVTDTGKGVHPDDVPMLFDRYFQGTKDENPEGGTGIGLAIAREFTELMGGDISVDSTWGVGSVFTVVIPEIVSTTGLVSERLQAEAQAELAVISNDGNGKLVMLVEDHHEMAQYISSIVSPYYRIISARNGKEALAILKLATVLPDLIISDVMMPEMDGFTLLELLKNDPVFYRIPVIMLTALADHQNMLKALNIGVDDYLTKPFLSNELLSRTANLIRNAASRITLSAQDEKELTELSGAETENTDNEVAQNEITVSPSDLRWLAELEVLVKKQIGKVDLNIASLSYDMAISERQLFRRVKSLTGLTPNRYIRTIRLQIAREAIESGKYRTISEVCYLAGFETPAYFSKLFKEHYGRDVSDLL